MASELETLTNIERDNQLNPVQRTRLEELRKMGSAGNAEGVIGGPINTSGYGISGGGSYSDLLNQQLRAMQQANAPAVASLQASLPEVQQKYADRSAQLTAQQPSIENRYKNIIDQITQSKEEAVGNVQTTLSREYGRRGISLTSGAYDQALNQAINPLVKDYSLRTESAGLKREDALAALRGEISRLTTQQVEEQRAIQNAIAQLQAGGNQQAATQALQIYQMGVQQRQADADRALQEKLAAQQDAGYQVLNVGGVGYIIDPATGKVINSFGGGTGSGSAGNWQPIAQTNTGVPRYTRVDDVSSQFNGGGVVLPNYATQTNKYDPLQYLTNPLVGLGVR